jgi:hypothetical protein
MFPVGESYSDVVILRLAKTAHKQLTLDALGRRTLGRGRRSRFVPHVVHVVG